MIIKMTILRLLGSSDDKEKIGVPRSEGDREDCSENNQDTGCSEKDFRL